MKKNLVGGRLRSTTPEGSEGEGEEGGSSVETRWDSFGLANVLKETHKQIRVTNGRT